jgi:hypothetical protein
MPHRRPPPKPHHKTAEVSTFRKQFAALEHKREELLRRLANTQAAAGRAHPGAKRALTLLNQTFRKASVAQRLAVLQAADWLIRVIEMTPPTL